MRIKLGIPEWYVVEQEVWAYPQTGHDALRLQPLNYIKMKIQKNHTCKFRVSLLELKIIQAKSKTVAQTTSAYIRDCALGKELRARLTEAELSAYRDLSYIKRSLVRISNLIKNRQDILVDVRNTIELINKHLTKFQ